MLPLIFTNRAAAMILEVAYVAWLVPEFIHTYSHRVDLASVKNDRRSGVVIALSIWIGIILAYALAHADPGADMMWNSKLPFIFGIALMVAGVAFRWYAVSVLGNYFSFQLAIQREQRVIQTGPYRWIRHPSYTGALITILGLGIVFTNWLSLLSVMIAGFIGYSYRVAVEERLLLAALGNPYREYMKRTKRFIPFVY